jgi:hypothetical protein
LEQPALPRGPCFAQSHTLYDGNGDTRRFTGQLGPADAVGALGDAQNRLTAFVQGDPWSGSAPGESYAYDADGYRFLRLSRDDAGKALLSLRDGEGRTLSEFMDEPSGGLKLVRDFVYGVGQLLIERQVTSAPPQMLLGSPLVSGGSYHLTVTDGGAAPSYELDIRTASGFQNRLTGLQLDAGQQVHVPESALSPGETNVLRLRAEGEPGTGYSVPVSLLYDPSVTPSSPNQIRALGVSRNGTDLVLRWALLAENGKQTKVSFRRTFYEGVAQLQADLDRYMEFYDRERAHLGYRTLGRTPHQVFLDGLAESRKEVAQSDAA